MSRINLSPNLETGLAIIDGQHQQFIALCNSYLQAMINGLGADVMDEVFLKLRAYVSYHFQEEERFQERIGYPHLEEHRRIHQRLTREVDEFRARVKDDPTISPNEVLDFLNGWILDHIQEEDLRFAEFARDNHIEA